MFATNDGENLEFGKKVFCARCGHSFKSDLEKCPRCNCQYRMGKSVLWCEKE